MSARNIFMLIFGTALLLAGCRTQPQQTHDLASEADIRQKIVGTWSADSFEGSGPITLTFGADGLVQFQRPGFPVGQAAWRTDGSCLVVTPKKDELVSNTLGFWFVWSIDEHELVFRRGISTAGPPERFTR